jgi:hypothetical protein
MRRDLFVWKYAGLSNEVPTKNTEDQVSSLGCYIRDKLLVSTLAVGTVLSSKFKRGIVQYDDFRCFPRLQSRTALATLDVLNGNLLHELPRNSRML